LGGKLAQIAGFGHYTVDRNSIVRQGTQLREGEEIPAFMVQGHETRVVHREYLGDISVPSSAAAFVNTSYVINAANPKTFPWLAPIAANYQQYRFNGLVFEFKTMSSDITSGGALGTVIMATNYDVNASPFANKLTMENSQFAISAKPSRSQIHAVECDPKQVANNLYYCRDSSQNLSLASDARFYDMGLFQIATSGLPGSPGTQLGELWISYDVSLLKPDLSNPSSAGTQSIRGQTSIGNTQIFGTQPIFSGSALATVGGSTFTFQYAGLYILTQQVNGTVLDIPGVSGTASIAPVWMTSGPRPGTLTNLTSVYKVTVSSPGQTVVMDYTGSATISGSYSSVTATTSFPAV